MPSTQSRTRERSEFDYRPGGKKFEENTHCMDCCGPARGQDLLKWRAVDWVK